LVVIAILGGLLALLLPAIESSREAARAAACKSNLRQIALAAQQFHAAHGKFPPGYLGPFEPDCRTGPDAFEPFQFIGLVPHLLPYLEQQAIYDTIDVDLRVDRADAFWIRRSGAREAAGNRLDVVRCPSASQETTVAIAALYNCRNLNTPAVRTSGEELSSAVLSNYLGSAGRFGVVGLPVDSLRGVFFNRSQVRSIPDGHSKTLLIGESVGGVEGRSYHTGHSWMGSGALPVTHGFGRRGRWSTFNSWHIGIVHFSYADGSVRGIQVNVDAEVLFAASGVAEGSVVEERYFLERESG
jgi:type II secretory pathway pseudopilin PulG